MKTFDQDYRVYPVDGDTMGITLFYYYAGKAPDNIPEWFVHTPPEKPKTARPYWNEVEDKNDRAILRDWLNDGSYDLPEHLQWFQKQQDQWWQENQQYIREDKKARYFQWRAYYANNLINTLP